ncbi:MAG: PKD domain-containing protein [Ignavibacteria bacterium]|nr:PKD domain-containing protein [Ignavibacteria bacterium]
MLPPVANAGLDKIITLPANSVSLDGSASTDDHTIVSYQWTKLTGIEGTLTTPNASTTNFTGLTAGVYTVELKVTDDSTAVGMDTIQIIVNPPLNQPPVANAGIDKIITLPVNSISLNGSASTDDHNIVAYQWIKLTGTGGTLATQLQL